MARARDDYDDDRDERDDIDDRDDRPARRRRVGPREVVPNYLVQSILVTLCCCLPFGIVAIIQSAKVNSLVAAGDYAAAREASASAYKWAVIGAIVGIVINLGVFVVQFLAGMAAVQGGR